MKRTRSKSAAKHRFEALAMATTMPLAVMVTLSHRLPLLAEALASSNAWRDPEVLRMTSEKVQAAGQTASALGGAIAASQQAIAGYALTQANANVALVAQPLRTPTELQAFTSDTLKRLSDITATLSEIGNRAVATSLRPAHRKVTANAKRLATQKRRA